MKKKQRFMRIGLIFSLLLMSQLSIAQNKWAISGTVTDSIENIAIPYATILVKSSNTDKTLNGATTDTAGFYELVVDSSEVYLEIRFIGFNTQIVRELNWEKNQAKVEVKLSQQTNTLDAVQVTAERSTMEFKLDKRVFNVGTDISSTGMGALDVLNNVPSVNVDIEGTISLRGNTGVQILINGKPSVLADDQTNALGSITADMIERIEVITNPSAKYNAEGTSGIINIVLKKEEKRGVNGSISVNTGWPHNHSVGGSVNLRTEKFNFFTQFGAGYRSLPENYNSLNQNLTSGTEVLSDGLGYRNEFFYNITLGTDYYINKYNTITLSGKFAYEIEQQPSSTDFSIFDASDQLISQYQRTEETAAKNPKWQYDLQYQKEFKNNKDHTLQFSTLGSFFGKDQSSEFYNEFFVGTNDAPNQQTTANFYKSDYTFKIDYANPITDVFTLETGALYEINDVGNDYSVLNQEGETWLIDSNLTNNFEFDQKVLGVYATGAFEWEKWGLMGGLRVENTDLKTLLTNTNESNNRNYTNFFPSLHASYKFSKTFSMQAGYSKRVFRPRLWDLNPFFNIRNSYSIRTGNPNLNPEFADSYEITAIKILKKASLNASVYHLYTTDVTERISYFVDNVNITTPMNIGTRNKTGLEFNGKFNIAKWFVLTTEANYGYFIRKGEFEGQNFNFEGSQWSSKATTKFKLKGDIDIELSGNYESAYKTVQGEVSGYFFVDAGIRKKLWKGKGVVNLAVRDVFASRIRESIVNQPTYYLYSFSQRGRFITLGFSYSFGKGEAMSYTGGRR